MAVFYKGQRMPWIIPGMKSGENINLDPKSFDPTVLPQRRIEMGGDNPPFIIIPVVPNRISTRKDGYIELILERHYDKEAKQSRNTKVIIGSDASWLLPGMMQPNDKYYDLFDYAGRLYNDPMKKEEQPEQPDPPKQADPRPDLTAETHKTDRPALPKQQQTKAEEKKTDKSKEDALLERERRIIRKEAELKKKERELEEWEADLEARNEEILIKINSEEQDHIQLLSHFLESYISTVEQQAKRKPDAPMTRKQIETINEVLSELRDFFTGSESEDYLHLAEEPDEQNPGTTNGEMALLLTAYQYTTSRYLYHGLRKKQKP